MSSQLAGRGEPSGATGATGGTTGGRCATRGYRFPSNKRHLRCAPLRSLKCSPGLSWFLLRFFEEPTQNPSSSSPSSSSSSFILIAVIYSSHPIVRLSSQYNRATLPSFESTNPACFLKKKNAHGYEKGGQVRSDQAKKKTRRKADRKTIHTDIEVR